MTLALTTHGYLIDDCPSSLYPVTGTGVVDPVPRPPHGHATLENPLPRAPTAMAVAFPLNPIPRPPAGTATLENPAPVAPPAQAVDQTPNPPPKPPGGGKAEDV
jgi:hypothetical protein